MVRIISTRDLSLDTDLGSEWIGDGVVYDHVPQWSHVGKSLLREVTVVTHPDLPEAVQEGDSLEEGDYFEDEV